MQDEMVSHIFIDIQFDKQEISPKIRSPGLKISNNQ